MKTHLSRIFYGHVRVQYPDDTGIVRANRGGRAPLMAGQKPFDRSPRLCYGSSIYRSDAACALYVARQGRSRVSNTVLFVLFFIGCIAFGTGWEIFRRRCPQCGRFFAREIVQSSASHRSDYRHDAMKKTTESDCRCKFCGHTWTQKYTSRKHRR